MEEITDDMLEEILRVFGVVKYSLGLPGGYVIAVQTVHSCCIGVRMSKSAGVIGKKLNTRKAENAKDKTDTEDKTDTKDIIEELNVESQIFGLEIDQYLNCL